MIQKVEYKQHQEVIDRMVHGIRRRLGDVRDLDTLEYFVSIENDEITGLICGKLIEDMAYIAYCVSRNAIPLLDMFKQWARDEGASKVVFLTMRNPMPFVRKYGFNLVACRLEMEL